MFNEFVDKLYWILEFIHIKIPSSFFTRFSCSHVASRFALICRKVCRKNMRRVYQEVVINSNQSFKEGSERFLSLVYRRQYAILCFHNFAVRKMKLRKVNETPYLVKLSSSFNKVLNLLLNDIVMLKKESKIFSHSFD